jgi:hypothetical protein
MITEELLTYVRTQLGRGATREDIRATLTRDGGWTDSDVNEVFDQLAQAESSAQSNTEPTPATPTPQTIQTPAGTTDTTTAEATRTQAVDTNASDTKSSATEQGSLVKTLVVSLIVLVGLAGTAYAGYLGYQYYQDSQWTPSSLIAASMIQMQSVTSYYSSTDMVLEGRARVDGDSMDTQDLPYTGMTMDMTIQGGGWSDVSNTSEPKFTGSSSLDLSVATDDDFMTMKFGASVEFILSGLTYYIRFNEVPAIPFVDLEPLEGRWVKIDIESLAETFPLGSEMSSMDLTSEISEQQKKMYAKIAQKFASEDMAALLDRSFTIVGKANVGGVEAFHLKGSLSTEDWKMLIRSWMEVAIEIYAEEELPGLSVDLAKMQDPEEMLAEINEMLADKEFNEFLDVLKNAEFNVWIGIEDKYLRRFELSWSTEGMSVDAMIFDASMMLEARYSGFNESVVLNLPSDTISAMEAFELIAPSLPGIGGTARGVDAMLEADLNYLTTESEIFYMDQGSFGIFEMGDCPIESSGNLESQGSENSFFETAGSVATLESISLAGSIAQAPQCVISDDGENWAILVTLSDELSKVCMDITGIQTSDPGISELGVSEDAVCQLMPAAPTLD